MSAHAIFDLAPLGSIVSWSDATPQPPERHKKKLSAWKTRNSQGRLIRKHGERTTGSYVARPDFTIHEGDFGGNGTIIVRIHRTFSVDSELIFNVLERPRTGSVRIFDRAGEYAELVHLAEDREAAEAWLKRHGYPNAVLDEVTANEVAADVIEGRAAA
ncbi:conserved hypothetical protein (plasmid) [Allorhizobium ampelinum S4]|uniref:Uncharacterized protein n=1 Tax=Allorhizobium ampelinum (strain ATCC BAA-846 / DSM 112012 / S4) TaxID=311402 RepID=B9K350_ALLAM|nr:hypothetical protein [Allorhizobium ampelinum]ACM39298.1 conserved hypothetical protein [Allorhizobium ampelinum S4]